MSVRSSPTAWRKEPPWPQPWRDGTGPGAVDDSLTNLQWLQEFSILTADPEKPATSSLLGHLRAPQGSDAPASPPAGDTAATGTSASLEKPTCSSRASPLQPLPPTQDTVDYRANGQVKPPHSYATLICMAMQASRGAKVSLSTIYAWITENFCYYRQADPSWQNSIRHNLSLNKCFRKVPRRKDEPGKGGFWQIDPQYADMLVNGVFRRRRMPAFPSPSVQPSAASNAEPGSCRGAGQGLRPDQMPRLLGPPRRLGKGKQLLAPRAGGAAWTAPPSPLAPVGGELSWASALEDTFAGGSGSFEDLELTAALGALATGEEGLAPHSHSQPFGAPSEDGGACAASALAEDLVLCTEPWEEAVAERTLGATWAFEEGACFAEGFLAEMQPWEV